MEKLIVEFMAISKPVSSSTILNTLRNSKCDSEFEGLSLARWLTERGLSVDIGQRLLEQAWVRAFKI